MRNRQKAVPLWKIGHFFTFFWPFPEFQDPGIPEFRILEFWNSGILEFWKWPIWRHKWYSYFHLAFGQNMPKYAQRQGGKTGTTYAFKSAISRILEFQNSRIRNPEFWDPGILEFWKWPVWRQKHGYYFCLEIGYFQNSRIPGSQNCRLFTVCRLYSLICGLYRTI